MTVEYHVTQYDGTYCGARNCAAASGAMAVAFAGGDLMTARQFREESGISCVEGVDTVSGGLRITDVMRVAQAHGVLLNYGGLQSWPTTALRGRLALGQGAIVLGDCQEAPVSPSLNVVYHSAFVHGLDGSDRTHWHDPRLPSASWQPVSKVITYWEGMDHGMRYAGFVAPNQIEQPPDSSTDPEEPEMTPTKVDPTSGFVRTKAACQAINVASGKAQTIGPDERYQAMYTAELGQPGVRWYICASSRVVDYAYQLAFAPADVDFPADPPTQNPVPPNTVTLGPGLYEVK